MASVRKPDPIDPPGRELQFYPANPTAARTLTTGEIEHYNEWGYVAPLEVFGPSEAIKIRTYVDELLANVLGADDRRNSYSINTYHLVCAGLWDLATDQRIVALVRDILGDEVVCWGSHLFAKLPGDGKEVPFHQDAVYWPLTPSKTVSVWLAIDPVDAGNAAMQFVPATHRLGPLPHDELALDGSRVLGRQVSGIERFPDRFVNQLDAGHLSLHSDLLLHGSEANVSDRRRAGLTLRYAVADVRLVDGYDVWRRSSVHVLGGDPSGFWSDVARPDGEHPELMAGFFGGFDGQPPDAS